MSDTSSLDTKLDGIRGKALIAGAAGLVITASSIVFGGPDMFFQSVLAGYLLTLGVALGGLSGVLLRHLAGGPWSVLIQRFCEAASRTLPLFFVLGLIVFGLGLKSIYPWTDPEVVSASHAIQNKLSYLSPSFFYGRFVLFFAVWLLFAWIFNSQSQRLDETGNQSHAVLMRRLAGPGIVLYFVTVTLASTDWAMSLEPEWFSTIYGPLFIIKFGLIMLSLSLILLHRLRDVEPLAARITREYTGHLANLLLAFTVLWTYLSFSQFLIIWSGNIPEEIGWYINRSSNWFNLIAYVLMLFHFLVPLLLLLWRRYTRDLARLRRIAQWLILMQVVDYYWNLAPSFQAYNPAHGTVPTLLFFLAAVAGFGGVWLFLFIGQLKRRPLLPTQDPRANLMLGDAKEAHSHA